MNNSVNSALFTELFTSSPGADPLVPEWSGPSYGPQNYPETPKKQVDYVSALPGCETLLKRVVKKVVKCEYFSGVFHTVAKQTDDTYVFLVFLGSLVVQMKVQTGQSQKCPFFGRCEQLCEELFCSHICSHRPPRRCPSTQTGLDLHLHPHGTQKHPQIIWVHRCRKSCSLWCTTLNTSCAVSY